ncbi:hypothetical protein SmJEL517_g00974 [Synchytrium microbalum]|uniref:Uncharacterized protein n=1 Tax=Synchytrium microbalum TaxID=1806994 RepID=A0A507C7C5_9FUNG|nr:uncharacterized protein SmJEL517_g00974 [Synchytrium microbalum]TPX36947.1 hypothetical protein SmJEL517_g00974 [Synchytrium microbalum]
MLSLHTTRSARTANRGFISWDPNGVRHVRTRREYVVCAVSKCWTSRITK